MGRLLGSNMERGCRRGNEVSRLNSTMSHTTDVGTLLSPVKWGHLS